MNVTAVVGANWGDEGKGKTTDYLAAEADMVVRFQGGSNAGHTIINDYGKFVLHLLPSGVFYPQVTNVLGPGVAVNMATVLNEMDILTRNGVPEPTLRISDRAQVVLPYHLLLDKYEEERLGRQQFGSTRQGIAPFYADKYFKVGVPVADLFDEARLRRRLETSLVAKNVLFEHLYHRPALTADELIPPLRQTAEKIRPFVCDTTALLHQALSQNKRILLEGQLGALRDPDHGIYPYPTSSSPLAGFAAVGAGIPPYAIRRIVAVAKAYSSCVGAGPFVTELLGPDGDELRNRGGNDGEYGATTGRPRRVGWFDAVATRYGCRVQGATEVALTLLDVLGYLEKIPVCVAYKVEGKVVEEFPTPAKLEQARPVFEYWPGWQSDISEVRTFEGLPKNAQAYVAKIETLIGAPIRWISVGPTREAMIMRDT
ncbi:MAG: adenylosuccinate synthase [Anaerolineae bacterium]|nr:adenylosuccinate synthase [Anaerolineae bacterium]